MKKKNLITCLASLGLILVDSSCEKKEMDLWQDKGKQGKSFQDAIQAELTPIYELPVPEHILNQLVALSSLSNDIFKDPSIAQSFSSNPEEYLASIGLPGNSLDLNSLEVKAVLALGDEEVRHSILNNDLPHFIKLLQEKGYLGWENIHVNDNLRNYFVESFKEIPELRDHVKSMQSIAHNGNLEMYQQAFFVAIAVAYVLVVVHSQAAVSYNVVAAINVGAVVNVIAKVNLKACQIAESGLSLHNPVLKIWGLETSGEDTYVINEFVEQTLDQIVDLTEHLDILNSFEPAIDRETLKSWLRKPVTQKIIDSGML